MNAQTTGPRPAELEISVFGPGYGESILVHVGNGRWIAIDSCLSSVTKGPRSLEYLAGIGVDPGSSVSLVVATHWHDDHVAGLSALFAACKSATFCCPQALTQREFTQLAEAYDGQTIGQARSSKELYSCLKEVVARGSNALMPPLKFASADKVVLRSAVVLPVGQIELRVSTLSPSDEMGRRALQSMAEQFAALGKGAPPDRTPSASPNNVATVVRVDVGPRSLLFGSDLEEEKNGRLVGWSAVLTGTLSLERLSAVFKVAHHGSKTGHHDGVWNQMLTGNPLCLLTPFRYARHRIPSAEERARILALTNRAFISSDPNRQSVIRARQFRKAEALINASARKRRLAVDQVGHIRWRASIEDSSDLGKIELFDGALPLGDVATS